MHTKVIKILKWIRHHISPYYSIQRARDCINRCVCYGLKILLIVIFITEVAIIILLLLLAQHRCISSTTYEGRSEPVEVHGIEVDL